MSHDSACGGRHSSRVQSTCYNHLFTLCSKFVDWVQALALGLGAPGLFLAAIADSSFLSLPEVVDILLIWMTTQHKSRMILYATSATLGSVVGLPHPLHGRSQGGPVHRPAFQRRPDGACPGRIPPVRADGRPDPVAAAAADAVQGFRPAGGCRRHQYRQVRAGHRHGPRRSATSSRRCSRSSTATRR